VAVERHERLPAPPDHGLILGRPGLVEEPADVLVGERPDPVHVQQRRLALHRLDLLDEPLEQLRRFRGLGEDPRRPPQIQGADPAELAQVATRWRVGEVGRLISSVSQRMG
jgi:hypothetical protein